MNEHTCEGCWRDLDDDYLSDERCNEGGIGVVLCEECAPTVAALSDAEFRAGKWRAAEPEPVSRAAILADVMREAGVSELGRYHLVEGELYVRQPRFTHDELAVMWATVSSVDAPAARSAYAKLDGYMTTHHALRRALVRNGE